MVFELPRQALSLDDLLSHMDSIAKGEIQHKYLRVGPGGKIYSIDSKENSSRLKDVFNAIRKSNLFENATLEQLQKLKDKSHHCFTQSGINR
jgi:hypothetical protein